PPERYYGRAGYRDDYRWRLEHQQRPLRPRRHICIPAYAGWLTVHARRHLREVSLLAGGVTHPYLAHYRPAFACSRILYPQPHRLVWRPPCAAGRATGLPRCAAATRVG